MRRVALIAWREFSATVFTLSFAFSLLMLPLMFMVATGLAPLMDNSLENLFKGELAGTVLVIDDEVARAIALEGAAKDTYDDVRFERASDQDAALQRLRDGEVVAVLTPAEEPATAKRSGQVLYVSTVVKLQHQSDLRWLVGSAEARLRIEQASLDPTEVRALVKSVRPQLVPVREGELPGSTSAKAHQVRELFSAVLPLIGLMLMWMGVLVSGQFLLQNTMEERSSKVMEVMLSAVSPMELMTGKIIGLGLVGALLTSVYGGTMGIGLLFAAMTDLVRWSSLVLFALYYVMAYLVLGSMFAAIGSAVNEVREAQSLLTPGMVIMTLPFLVLIPVLDDPNGTMAVAMSYIPLMTPFVMAFRVMSSEPVPWLQVLTTLVWGYVWAVACVWAAARVFRVGVLMQGKAPTFGELARWIFQD